MIIYGLQATGESANGWKFRAICREMFTLRSDAEGHKEVFSARCCNPNEFDYVDPPESLEITITEHELMETTCNS